ncbi:lytic transglycosylase domain-containing protein [Methylocaldum sp. MU1018]
MSGIKVPIRADISQLKSDLETLTREAEKVSRALGNNRVNFDTSRAMEALRRLWAEANRLEQKLQRPSKIDLGVAEASEQLVRAREAAEGLARAIHGDGVSAYSRATREAREYHRTISGIIHDQNRLSDLLRREVASAGGSIVGSVVPGFGNVAGTASRFASGGAGIGSMIGRGALGAVVGAAAYSSIKTAQQVSAAEQEAIGTSVLRNTIGGLTADFNALRDAARNIIYDGGLGVTSNEMLGLERQYAKIAGGRGVNALTSETAEAIKLARAMGLEPGEGVSFFGQAQRFRATGSDEQGQRRFAMLIGEAVAKVGFSQSSEVLQAIAGFLGTSARSIVGPAAGAEGYSSMLSKLTGPGSVYGADVAGGASLMARMSAGFQSGFAGAGPAGQAFSLGVMQSEYSRQFNAVDVAGVMQAGPFSSLRDAIGPGSVMYKSADAATQARYLAMLKEAGGKADAPMLDTFIRGIESSVPAALVNDALSNAFGISVREAAAFRVAMKQHGGTAGIQARLRAMGIDTSDPVQTISLAKYLGADRDSLMREAARFQREGVGTDELQSAKASGDTERLRQEITKIASSQDLKDDGERTRDSIAKVETVLTEFASKLLPINQSIRDAVLFAAGKTPSEFAKWQTKNVTGPFDGVISDAQERVSDRSGQLRLLNEKIRVSKELAAHGYGTDEYAAMLQKRSELEQANAADRGVINRTKIDRDAALIRSPSMYDSIFAEAGQKYGIDPAILKAIAVHESHLNPDATNVNQNGSGDYGIMQLNSQGAGAGLSREQLMDPRTNIMTGSKFFAGLVKKYGYTEALKRYNGSGPAAERYRKEMMETLGRAGIDIHDPLPAEHRARTGADKISMHTFRGEFTLRDSQGREIADPVSVNHRYELPHTGLA